KPGPTGKATHGILPLAYSSPRPTIKARASRVRCSTTTKANARLPLTFATPTGAPPDFTAARGAGPQELDLAHDPLRRLRPLDPPPLQPGGRPLRGLTQGRRRHRRRRRALGAVFALVPLVLGQGAGGATRRRGHRLYRSWRRAGRPPARSSPLSGRRRRLRGHGRPGGGCGWARAGGG